MPFAVPAVLELSFDLFKKLGRGKVENGADFEEHPNACAALAKLEQANVVALNPRLERKRLLGQAPLLPDVSQYLSKGFFRRQPPRSQSIGQASRNA